MKKQFTRAGMLGMATLLLSIPAVSNAWDYELQGPDGTLWGLIAGAPSENQAGLNLPYAACAIGFHQSPIAINLRSGPVTINPITQSFDNNPSASVEKRANGLIAHYARSVSSTEGAAVTTNISNVYVFENSGHAVQVAFAKGYPGKLLIGREVYSLLQFHFHAPSEHVIVTDAQPAGIQYAGELHFVHQNLDGKLAVLGVLLDDSDGSVASNPTLAAIINNTPKDPGPEHSPSFNSAGAGIPLDPSSLIPMGKEHVFTYAGSLTTPPCSEGVSWYVLSQPLKVSPAQMNELREFHESNNRIVQNTNYSKTNVKRTVEIERHFTVDRGHHHVRHER